MNCDRCGHPLPRLPDGQTWWASKNGQRLHVDCALGRVPAAPAASVELPTAEARWPVKEEDAE